MDKLKEYQSDLGEKAVKIVFETFYNLKLKRILKIQK